MDTKTTWLKLRRNYWYESAKWIAESITIHQKIVEGKKISPAECELVWEGIAAFIRSIEGVEQRYIDQVQAIALSDADGMQKLIDIGAVLRKTTLWLYYQKKDPRTVIGPLEEKSKGRPPQAKYIQGHIKYRKNSAA